MCLEEWLEWFLELVFLAPDEMAGAEGVMETLTQLMTVQSDAMTAQAKAIAVQSLPSLACYTGEGCDASDDGLDRWLERFRERTGFAGWSVEEELYQLKLHLDKTALDVYRSQ